MNPDQVLNDALAYELVNGIWYGTAEFTAPRQLTCCCCGAYAMGRQWHNRDTGYGLCVDCIDYCGRNTTAMDFTRCYGIRGIHFDIPTADGSTS